MSDLRPSISNILHVNLRLRTRMEAIHCLKTRRSIRAYRPDPVPQPLLEDLVDCARLAPTAMNRQQWTFVIVRDAAARQRIADLTGHAVFLATAPACVAVFCGPNEFWVEDGSAATENLLLAAHAYGLGGCWVAAYQTPYGPAVAELLGAPADQRLLALVAIGYPAEQPSPDKRPLADVICWDRFPNLA